MKVSDRNEYLVFSAAENLFVAISNLISHASFGPQKISFKKAKIHSVKQLISFKKAKMKYFVFVLDALR